MHSFKAIPYLLEGKGIGPDRENLEPILHLLKPEALIKQYKETLNFEKSLPNKLQQKKTALDLAIDALKPYKPSLTSIEILGGIRAAVEKPNDIYLKAISNFIPIGAKYQVFNARKVFLEYEQFKAAEVRVPFLKHALESVYLNKTKQSLSSVCVSVVMLIGLLAASVYGAFQARPTHV